MVSIQKLVIRGARQHNLKDVDLEIPRDKLVVLTGLSGSGKSSLAFDTIYAEGQRRYVESLSAYARQFLGQMDKPDVDFIEGLSPAISIDQKTTSRNPRSTVGTVTEIYDYLRLLFARIGRPHCYQCGKPISQQTVEQIVDRVMDLGEGTRLQVLAPIVRGRKGEYRKLLQEIHREGFVRVRVDGELRETTERIELDKNKQHWIEIVVDRIIVREGIQGRLADSIETALRRADGLVLIDVLGRRERRGASMADTTAGSNGAGAGDGSAGSAAAAESDAVSVGRDGSTPSGDGGGQELLFSEKLACADCGVSYEELAPRMFSFNSPYGACPECDGLGVRMEIDPELVINKELSIRAGGIRPWANSNSRWLHSVLQAVCEEYDISMDKPMGKLSDEQLRVLLYGTGTKKFQFQYVTKSGRERTYESAFEGVVPQLARRHRESSSNWHRAEIERFMSSRPCKACGGGRLRPETLAVTIGDRNIMQVTAMSIRAALDFFDGLTLTDRERTIAHQVLKEIRARLGFLVDVGLDYLTLDRTAGSLSGGEAQRIRLATQIGSQLVGVLYILDEPSIGLHQRDNARLLSTLQGLRDLGNTVIVVEHDEDTIRTADFIVDIGPGAGAHGGEVVAAGTLDDIMAEPRSVTGQYLSGRRAIRVPAARRPGNGKRVRVRGAREHNLKNIDVEIPLGVFVCVTGVSGSGKSTLVNEILHKTLAQKLHGAGSRPGEHDGVDGLEHLDKVIDIDQSPIGRTPRSNPATYTGAFDGIRALFSQVPEANMRGYKPGRFSFNVKGGRCEACTGDGIIRIEMHFLPDVYVPCEVCKGKRYNRETLEVRYKGKSIADVLEMRVDEALEFFSAHPPIQRKLQTLYDVGLGYIRLGQPATTLSGGEAQRIKLATELSRRSTGKTLYILDEPTTGLHTADIEKLLDVLNRLVEGGDTVLVIEHNLDVIKTADYIIDLGPEGGDGGGRIVATGTPEEVVAVPESHTGRFLKPLLAAESALASSPGTVAVGESVAAGG